ncbi:polyprenyl synthetase family protein [Protaetiibacter mangrovi]|uniref:Polyprenyl synthetase family protein n=1 Tax=Protaetiibacter mangrovi TaxID=2970926 RepID=A0ABT1ZB82_9MICO|nr:polyprenyl synthetase family protein [Protaetiibacter mangrovi]MCS0497957.1 polyprenyl synthetase family protein [Protaetiibacter mangrovi]TPX02769.1 polyprenyl synthetase family protein [Schumannella luteola]
MAESTRLVDRVAARIDDALDTRETVLAAISPDLAPLVRQSRELLAGGKRFRALFCYWGWQSVAAIAHDADGLAELEGADLERELPAVVSVAAALELFHAAALVHDDIMDRSDLRRGRLSAHRAFERLHRDAEWDGDAATFGTSTALLLGDLLLGWSDELFEEGLALLADREAAQAARAEFFRMRTEVTVGQYLDVLEEDSWRSRPDNEALPRAHRVIVYKSAKYSVEAPLAIGGALAGGSLAQLAALREFGLPLGVAFQLRDDMLGVFGDPEVTGKPSGDDLREGKRTVLVGLARQKMPPTAVRVLDELLGDPGLDDAQVRMLQNTMRDSGAADQVERIIAHNVRVAREALADAPLSGSARAELAQLADRVTRRDS